MSSPETEASSSSSTLPKFLVLGGCGFIGRHLVEFLLDKAEIIHVIDKTPPEIAWLNSDHAKVFASPKVVFHSANLISQERTQKVFDSIDTDIDYIINLASETRKGQSEPVYKEGIYKLTTNVIQLAAKRFSDSLKNYVEFSSGTLYPNDKTPHKETEKVDQWNAETKYKYRAEQEIGKTLKKFVVIRPAIVYGKADRGGITPRLVIGGIYKHLKEMMKLPWTSEISMNTVHVKDLVRATHFLALNGKHGEIYNVVDSGQTTQGDISSVISEIFDINHDYWGTTFSTLAKLDMNDVIDEINDKHMAPWAELCQIDGVGNTPLNPFLHSDTLAKKNISLSGKKLADLGFTDLEHPTVTKEALIEIIEDFIELKMFPKSLVQK
jgi:nucleoside-diphosphate-sugar epimerase